MILTTSVRGGAAEEGAAREVEISSSSDGGCLVNSTLVASSLDGPITHTVVVEGEEKKVEEVVVTRFGEGGCGDVGDNGCRGFASSSNCDDTALSAQQESSSSSISSSSSSSSLSTSSSISQTEVEGGVEDSICGGGCGGDGNDSDDSTVSQSSSSSSHSTPPGIFHRRGSTSVPVIKVEVVREDGLRRFPPLRQKLPFKACWTIGDFKMSLKRHTGLALHDQVLLFQDHQLTDNIRPSVEDLNLVAAHGGLVLRRRGQKCSNKRLFSKGIRGLATFLARNFGFRYEPRTQPTRCAPPPPPPSAFFSQTSETSDDCSTSHDSSSLFSEIDPAEIERELAAVTASVAASLAESSELATMENGDESSFEHSSEFSFAMQTSGYLDASVPVLVPSIDVKTASTKRKLSDDESDEDDDDIAHVNKKSVAGSDEAAGYPTLTLPTPPADGSAIQWIPETFQETAITTTTGPSGTVVGDMVSFLDLDVSFAATSGNAKSCSETAASVRETFGSLGLPTEVRE